MKKIFIWGGLIGFVVFFLLGFLSGATNGPDNQPILALVYGTNQVMWAFFALVSVIFFIIGLVMMIMGAIKERK